MIVGKNCSYGPFVYSFLDSLECLYIFLIYCFYYFTYLCNNFYGLSALVGCWSSASLMRIIYKLLNVCLSWLHSFYICVAIVTQTDRPKSGRNRCVIEVFFCVCLLSSCFWGFFWGCSGFCHRTESDLFFCLFHKFDLPHILLLTLLKKLRKCLKLH